MMNVGHLVFPPNLCCLQWHQVINRGSEFWSTQHPSLVITKLWTELYSAKTHFSFHNLFSHLQWLTFWFLPTYELQSSYLHPITSIIIHMGSLKKREKKLKWVIIIRMFSMHVKIIQLIKYDSKIIKTWNLCIMKCLQVEMI